MSRDELHHLAERDTPEEVRIPATWQGLAVWAVGRFGAGIILAGILGYGLNVVYVDSRTDRDGLLKMYHQSIETQEAMSRAIVELAKQVEANTRAAEAAHRFIK